MRIAVLEDHGPQRLFLVQTLERLLKKDDDVVVCLEFDNGLELQQVLRKETFDLLILNWNVPGLDGIELVKWVNSLQERRAPVLMLSSRRTEADVVKALDSGAADYIVTPLRPLEFQARIERLLDRSTYGMLRSSKLRIGRWELDKFNRQMRIDADAGSPSEVEKHELADGECKLLTALFQNVGRAISRGHMLECAEYPGEGASFESIDAQIYKLRRKLQFSPERGLVLHTVYGRGYRLEAVAPENR